MEKSKRIVFFGTPEFAVPALEALFSSDRVPLAIVTAPDRPAGRGLSITSSAVFQYAEKKGFGGVFLKPTRIDDAVVADIAALHPTVGVVVAYGLILPQRLIDLFPEGLLNIHPSLLPRHRGSAPLQYQVLAGDAQCGVSIMKIDAQMDHGPICAQELFTVDPTTITYTELHDISAKKGAELLTKALDELDQGALSFSPQDDTKATYTRLLKKTDGLIDWTEGATEIDRKVRALNPWPGTFSFLDTKRIKILKTSLVTDGVKSDMAAGSLYVDSSKLLMATADGFLCIEMIQMEGEAPMAGERFAVVHGPALPASLKNLST